MSEKFLIKDLVNIILEYISNTLEITEVVNIIIDNESTKINAYNYLLKKKFSNEAEKEFKESKENINYKFRKIYNQNLEFHSQSYFRLLVEYKTKSYEHSVIWLFNYVYNVYREIDDWINDSQYIYLKFELRELSKDSELSVNQLIDMREYSK